MKIHPNTQEGAKVKALFMQVLREHNYISLASFCQEHDLKYRLVHQRIFYNRWINLEIVNQYIQLIDRRKIFFVGSDVVLK